MTALCGGGPSGAQSTPTALASLTAAGVEIFIATVLKLPTVASLLAPIIASIVTVDLVAYCSTDPPADPGLTATDVENALAFPSNGQTFFAQNKIATWFRAHYWWSVCQCTSTTTPPPPTPSNPGTASENPGLPQPAQPLCWQKTVSYVVQPESGGTVGLYDMTQNALPPGPYTSETGDIGGTTVTLQSVPLGAGTNLSMQVTLNEPLDTSASAPTVYVVFNAWSDIGSPDTADGLGWIIGTTGADGQLAQPVMCTTVNCLGSHPIRGWSLSVQNSDIVQHSGTVTISWNCTTPFTSQPCCSPDPALEGELSQILQYVQAIYAGLPITPNSFAEGTVHAGLSGAGSVTFTAIPIAIKVTLTTIPPWVGLHIGNPDFYFDVGFLSFATSEGNYAQQRIQFATQVLSVPILAGSVGYTLYDGVVASITELTPGP